MVDPNRRIRTFATNAWHPHYVPWKRYDAPHMPLTPEDVRAQAALRREAWTKENGLAVHVINLTRREDRWARIEEIGRDYPWLSFVRQQAIDLPSHPWIACALGHQLAVFDAKLRGDPYVLVAEDDMEPTRWFDRLPSIIEAGDEREFDSVSCGTVSYPDQIIGDPTTAIVETEQILSSHLTCYYARGYDKVLLWPLGWGSDHNVDPAVAAEHHERMRLLPPVKMKRGLTVPFLAIQKSDWSDNCKRHLNLQAHWRDAEEAWLRAGKRG